MAKAKLPPGPLKVFSDNNVTAILDTNGNEVVHWSGFDDSNRTRAEHELLARELVRRFNAASCDGCAGTTSRANPEGGWLRCNKCLPNGVTLARNAGVEGRKP